MKKTKHYKVIDLRGVTTSNVTKVLKIASGFKYQFNTQRLIMYCVYKNGVGDGVFSKGKDGLAMKWGWGLYY